MSSDVATSEAILLGVIDFKEAKRIQHALEERGVKLELRHNPGTCSSGGCSPTVEAWVPGGAVDEVRAFLRAERARDLGDLAALDLSHTESVIDPSQESAQCPACGTRFSPQAHECPDCGLGFGIPDGA